MTEALKVAVCETLQRMGWTLASDTAIARKQFQTAVGPKEAVVYLDDYGPHCDNLVLGGSYHSEGRNCLESGVVLIPKKTVGAQVSHLVAKYVKGAEDAILNSYAARLYKTSIRSAH